MGQSKKDSKLPFEDEEEILREARKYFEEEAENVRNEKGNTRNISTVKTDISYLRKFADKVEDEIIATDRAYPETRDLFNEYEPPNNGYGRALGYLKDLGIIDTWSEGTSRTRWDLTEIDDNETFKNKIQALTSDKNLDYITPGIDVDKLIQDT